MARSSTAAPLAAYQRSYRELAERVAGIGFIAAGTITHRHTRCGKPGCRCQAEPPRPHGPYYQWTGKINGKTVTRRLTEGEATLYQEWITNDRQLRTLITEMRQIAAQATELIMRDASDRPAQV